MMPSCVCSFHFKTGHHKKTETSWDTTEMRYCISNVGSCQFYSKVSPNLQRYLNKLLAFDFTWKNPTKKHDSKHLCDRNKREGMRMRMNDVLTVGLSCQLWPTSSNFLTIVTINAWSIQICHCFYSEWQVSKNQIWTLPFSANEKNTKSILTWYSTKSQAWGKNFEKIVGVCECQSFPSDRFFISSFSLSSKHSNLKGTQRALSHEISPTIRRTKGLVSRHGSSQERYQFCIVRSIPPWYTTILW